MGKIYHLKSYFFSKKCIFFISDTGTGAKKIRLISPRAAMRVCKAILTHPRNAQRFFELQKVFAGNYQEESGRAGVGIRYRLN